ncbi:hypothetical protein [Nonomuraea diastatica]|uniref:Uncharacterized protein n=1 Tax=Nonomuraea diastatica TaxID=1848329 RepID=A0A4R4WI11_9ACTN|nr:hypothetical protein [Nonomuraea diastatica]TDD18689.1 hypothetical protein E1294_23300 [Nonomuraea diastatica]
MDRHLHNRTGGMIGASLCAKLKVRRHRAATLLRGTPFGAQLKFVFGFDKSNGVAIGLAITFSVLTAIIAAIAGSVKSDGRGPTTATPPRP